MKFMRVIFLVIGISIVNYPQFQRNYWYQIGPFGGDVSDISLSSSTSEIAVVTDAGASILNYDWLDVIDASEISKVFYYPSSSNQFLFAVKKNQVLKTHDNGYHWQSVFTALDSLKNISVSNFSPYQVFLWSDSLIYLGYLDSIYWGISKPELGNIITLLAHPVDSQAVYLGTTYGLYKSTNSGRMWNNQPLLNLSINSIAISEVFPQMIYASSNKNNFIYYSSNGGMTWDSSNVGLPLEINNLCCSPTVNGMAFAATNEGIFKTTNGGINWFKFSNQLSFGEFGVMQTLPVHICELKNNKIYAGTPEGLFESDVQTDSWQQIGPYNEKVKCITKNVFEYDNHVVIGTPKGIKYSNHSSWSTSNLYSQSGLAIIKVISSYEYNNQFLLAASDNKSGNSIIYRSTDYGINWDSVFSLPDKESFVESFYQRADSSNIVLMLVNSNKRSYGMYKSEISGTESSWLPIESSFQKNFITAVSNPSHDSLFFVINDNELYLSIDGGRNINFVSSIPGNRFNHLIISNRNNIDPIYAAGDGVKRSFDFVNWENFGLDTLEVIEMAEDWSSLFAITKYNGIFTNYYFNGEWYPFDDGLATKEITDIVNFTHAIMHIGTANNSVYMVYSIINHAGEDNGKLMNSFNLSHNYPNPFNPITKIKFSVPFAGAQHAVSVQLKVYDILGNEVATLVNEEKSAGYYEVEFDAAEHSSGVYFYQLKAGSFVDTKKMILLR